MKTKEQMKALTQKTLAELDTDLKDKKSELFNLRFQLATGQLQNTAALKQSPFADSPESITASDPSRIELATSVHSARVGRGFLIIESSICVAVIVNRPRSAASCSMYFCARNTFSGAISIPRSPRATMMPSTFSRISA